MRTRVVLHEKGMDFDTEEVDLSNKSQEFLRVSPTGKVPVIAVDEGDALYESNVVNQYLEEATPEPHLLPENLKTRAFARIWMQSADENFYPTIFVVSKGEEMGFSEERIQRSRQKLPEVLSRLEERLEDRDYLADGYSLADIAHSGYFQTLRSLAESGEIPLSDYPNVEAWVTRVEERDAYQKAI